jgi:hypothetical protein
VDAVHYYETYHFELLNDVKGVSLEKLNPSLPSGVKSNWHSAAASAGFATPGKQNSQFISLEEHDKTVELSTGIFSPDNDGFDDVLVFSLNAPSAGYITDIFIFNDLGHLVFGNKGNRLFAVKDAFSWNGAGDDEKIVDPGIYMAYVEVYNLEGSKQKYRLPFVVAKKF